MPSLTERSPTEPDRYNPQQTFYRQGIALLRASKIPFLVGGAYAMRHYTGIVRETKDFDVFLRSSDLQRALDRFSAAGYDTEVTFSHWLGKT